MFPMLPIYASDYHHPYFNQQYKLMNLFIRWAVKTKIKAAQCNSHWVSILDPVDYNTAVYWLQAMGIEYYIMSI